MSDAEAPPYAQIAAGEAAPLAARMAARIAATPNDCGARYVLFAALAASGQPEAARAALDEARLLHSLLTMREMGADVGRLQTDAAYAASVGQQLYGAHHVAVASVAYRAAVEAGCDDPTTLLSHALALQHQGRAEEAAATFEAIGARYPTAAISQFLLPSLFATANGEARHAAAACAWAARHAPHRPSPPFAQSRVPERALRVGYVCPNFGQNQARQFIAPLFDRHDRARFTVYAFPNEVETGDRWAAPVEMRPLAGLDDEAAAAAVRAERIDILVDCWGHAAGSRLAMFAHRPAPIHVSWLNYQQTTGVAAMDYAVQSDFADSDGMQALFVEEVWRMGEACAAFRPDPGPVTSPAPMLVSGRPTFGAFVNPAKLSDETVALWAAILSARPTARLILKYNYYVDPVLQATTSARFLAHGANPAQLEFRGRTSGAAYHAEFAEIDLALDPTPCPGGTTSLEALSRGVPVLTLSGDTFYARLGASVVAPAGFPDLVAQSGQDYVDKAIALSSDAARMQALRERVPAGFAAAPYRDEAGMTRRLESVYRAMFSRWCERAEAA